MSPQDYGDLYWCVKVPRSVAKSGEIYLYAKALDIQQGHLVAVANDRNDGTPRPPLFAMAPGRWIAYYGASVIDGSAVCVEHWAGELLETKGE
jgi:hypothetical protein